MYVMLRKRPDIGPYVVCVICKYQSNPSLKHWIIVRSNLKYLRRTKEFLLYGREELKHDDFIDFDFQLEKEDRQSTFRFISTCNGWAINCKSSKQDTTTNSTTERK